MYVCVCVCGLVLQRRITGGQLERARSQSRRAPSLGWRRCREGKRSASRRRVWPLLWKYGVGDCTRTQHELGGPAVAPLRRRERCHLPPQAREAGNCTWAVGFRGRATACARAVLVDACGHRPRATRALLGWRPVHNSLRSSGPSRDESLQAAPEAAWQGGREQPAVIAATVQHAIARGTCIPGTPPRSLIATWYSWSRRSRSLLANRAAELRLGLFLKLVQMRSLISPSLPKVTQCGLRRCAPSPS